MTKVTEMNKEILKTNLIATIKEISEKTHIYFSDCKFVIIPIMEKNKPLSSEDDFMRLNILSQKNIGDKKIHLKQVIGVLGGLQPLVPIWINVSFVEFEGNTAIFKLETSLRFRKPSLLRNTETGHAPFKAIYPV